MLIYCLFFLCFQQRLVFFQSSFDRCISQNFLSQIYPFLEESTKFSPSVYQICLIHWFSKSKTGILHVFLRHHVMESAKMIYFIGGKCSNKVFIIILLLFLLFIRSSLLVFSITWLSWLNQVLFEQWANIFVLYLFHLFLFLPPCF